MVIDVRSSPLSRMGEHSTFARHISRQAAVRVVSAALPDGGIGTCKHGACHRIPLNPE
ncbi:MAG: hypothetical protein JWM95_5163 [Gemmatimonadetes bacterium]|nr:hypothetical protein [Gemmatimonadota bacterium]